MSDFHKILKSFKLKETLNSDIWEKTNGDYTMKPKVRERLLKIANDFIEFLKKRSIKIRTPDKRIIKDYDFFRFNLMT